jgi:beta-1,4-N-acetylglucosaminyltransferase
LRKRLAHPLRSDDEKFKAERYLAGRSATYFFIVLGSGGHTKEMLAMLEADHGNFETLHRRYLVSSGDSFSLKQLDIFERNHWNTYESKGGTYDKHIVTRARRVYQSLLTTPFTSLMSLMEIFPLLLSQPKTPNRNMPRYPDLIITNGPATGFFVGFAAYLLKIFWIAPEESMQILYVESWARVRTLSLTGKLFYYTNIADVFLVQHQPVAEAYGVHNAGYLVLPP